MSFILKQFKYVFIKEKLCINLNLHCNKCSWIHVIDYCLDPDFTRCLLLPLVVHRLVWGLQLAPSCEGALRWTGKEFQTLTHGHLIKSKWTLISDSKYTLDCLCWKCKMSLYWISARRNVRAALGSCSTCSWRLQSSQLGNRGIQNNNTKKKNPAKWIIILSLWGRKWQAKSSTGPLCMPVFTQKEFEKFPVTERRLKHGTATSC